MHVVHTSLVLSIATLVLAAASATTSTACTTCWDIGIKKTDCANTFGKFNEEQCKCVGARPFQPPPSTSSGTCASDADCSAGRCRDGKCRAAECISDLDCRSEARCSRSSPGAPGTCRRNCSNDDECAPAFACVGGLCGASQNRIACEDAAACPAGLTCGTSLRECLPRCIGSDGEPCAGSACDASEACLVVDYGWCDTDADCRASEGASCKGGRCYRRIGE